jgi:hypothetical protein
MRAVLCFLICVLPSVALASAPECVPGYTTNNTNLALTSSTKERDVLAIMMASDTGMYWNCYDYTPPGATAGTRCYSPGYGTDFEIWIAGDPSYVSGNWRSAAGRFKTPTSNTIYYFHRWGTTYQPTGYYEFGSTWTPGGQYGYAFRKSYLNFKFCRP